MYDTYDFYNSTLGLDDYGVSSSDILSSSGLSSDVLSSSNVSTSAASILGAVIVAYLFILVIALIFALLKYIGAWKTFKKAGVDGWEALIPVHNLIVEFQLAGLKTYWYFLLLVPIANIIILCWKDIELAKAYGKSAGFGIGLFLLGPIFYLILGLGKAEYVGPTSSNSNNSGTTGGTATQTSTTATNTQPVQESLFDNNANTNANINNDQGTNNNQ